jgi:hypothetical protein
MHRSSSFGKTSFFIRNFHDVSFIRSFICLLLSANTISFLFSNHLVTCYGWFTLASVPENDRCVNAILLLQGEPVNGDNTGANYDYINQGVCGAQSDRRAIWYEIVGVGKEVTVYVCTNNDKVTDYGIFRQCNTQDCEGAPPQQTNTTNCDDDEANTYSFFADDGETFYVHIRSDTLDPEGTNVTVWYTEPSDQPSAAPISSAPAGSYTNRGITATILSILSALSAISVARYIVG